MPPMAVTPRSLVVSASSSPKIANVYGTGIVGGVDYFIKRYGPAATHTAIARMSPQWRPYLQPNAPLIGLLGAKKYPWPFVGELLHQMALAVKVPDEDLFLRQVASAAVEATISTVARVFLRTVVSPADVAKRAQELWDAFTDAGRITISGLTDREYLSALSDLPGHDTVMCKVAMEGARRLVERTGVRGVEARREKCISWGHDHCLTRMRWIP